MIPTVDPVQTPPAGRPLSDGEPPAYVINLYTSVTDPCAAVDLATKVTEAVRDLPQVNPDATTVSLEDDPAGEPQQVFEVRVLPQSPDELVEVWAAEDRELIETSNDIALRDAQW